MFLENILKISLGSRKYTRNVPVAVIVFIFI